MIGERLQAGRITRVHLGTLEEQPANVHRAVHGAAPRRAAAAARGSPRACELHSGSANEDCVRHGVGLPELTKAGKFHEILKAGLKLHCNYTVITLHL